MTNRVVRVVVPPKPTVTPDIWAAAHGIRRDLPAGETIEKECGADVWPTVRKWIQKGTLLAADEATAKLADVDFVPAKPALQPQAPKASKKTED